jgi:hypothetical protein
MVELGSHAATERASMVTLRLTVRAPGFYLDICTLRSVGAGGG